MTTPRPAWGPGSEPASVTSESDAADRIRALELELERVREDRVRMQRIVAEGPGLLVAIERVERDRSALTSPEVEELRTRVQEQHDKLAESWDNADRVRYLAERLRTRFAADYGPMDAAFARELETRRAAVARAAEAGVRLTVPLTDGVVSDQAGAVGR